MCVDSEVEWIPDRALMNGDSEASYDRFTEVIDWANDDVTGLKMAIFPSSVVVVCSIRHCYSW